MAEAAKYATLKAAILASLAARAQKFHSWNYDPAQPAQPQIAALTRLTRNWLTGGNGPLVVDGVVLDHCIRALPPDAKKYGAQTSPATLEDLEALLENHKVMVDMMRPSTMEPLKGARPNDRQLRNSAGKVHRPEN